MTSPNNRPESGRTIIPAVRASNHWQDRAACKTADAEAIFFPVLTTPDTIQAAKEICQRCPVIQDCKRFALENRETHGVWGGMSEKELQAARRAPQKPRAVRIVEKQRNEWDAAVAEHGDDDKAIARALRADVRTIEQVRQLVGDTSAAVELRQDQMGAAA
ncbi:WhiB family transcriptional regulator [Streptomyces albidoflavus]